MLMCECTRIHAMKHAPAYMQLHCRRYRTHDDDDDHYHCHHHLITSYVNYLHPDDLGSSLDVLHGPVYTGGLIVVLVVAMQSIVKYIIKHLRMIQNTVFNVLESLCIEVHINTCYNNVYRAKT